MKRIAFVTYTTVPQIAESDALVLPYLAKHKVKVEAAAWDDPHVNWKIFDAVVMRSAWNYHTKYALFQDWLSQMEEMSVSVWNPTSVLRWNSNKSYLFRLQARGVSIIPSMFVDRLTFKNILAMHKWKTIVVKPLVGASAYGVKKFSFASAFFWIPYIWMLLLKGQVIVQEFVSEIANGEYSLIFFNKKFSHAILRTPKKKEFRTQPWYGGTKTHISVSDDMIKAAERVLLIAPEPLLYARVDGVIIDGRFSVMEVELCEPNLFLDTDTDAPKKFADAILEQL